MASVRIEINLDEGMIESLQGRVQHGEFASLSDGVRADLDYAAQMRNFWAEADADAAMAYEEMESGEDPGIPIEEIMARYGMSPDTLKRKAA